MIVSVARGILVLTSAGALAAGVRAARMPLTRADVLEQPRPPVAGRATERTHPDSLLMLAMHAAPFRVRRVQPSVRYDPSRTESGAPPASPAPPKPALVLSGVLMGSTAVAAIEGIPGVEGTRLLARGDTVAGLRVRRIEAAAVTVTGYDTTWVLRVREAWQ